jgi:pyrimidine operon attenuation protein/uracil phosphoribosyltransferase
MVLADRRNRELPIAADFVGEQVSVPDNQILVLEKDGAGKFRFQLEERAQ